MHRPVAKEFEPVEPVSHYATPIETEFSIEKSKPVQVTPSSRHGGGSGVASFMTANKTVIFRRFDEVHVQLLLCLQDEITDLERELMRVDGAMITRTQRDAERHRVLRELRRVVAEYGMFLFLSPTHPAG